MLPAESAPVALAGRPRLPAPSRAAEPSCRAHSSHGTHTPPMASPRFGHACAGLSPLAKGIEKGRLKIETERAVPHLSPVSLSRAS